MFARGYFRLYNGTTCCSRCDLRTRPRAPSDRLVAVASHAIASCMRAHKEFTNWTTSVTTCGGLLRSVSHSRATDVASACTGRTAQSEYNTCIRRRNKAAVQLQSAGRSHGYPLGCHAIGWPACVPPPGGVLDQRYFLCVIIS